MDKTGKNFNIIGTRPSLLGDIISSLIYWTYLDRKYPESFKTQSIAYKCSQIIPLLYNHPLIDKIHVNRILEQPTKEEWDFYNSHDLVIRPDLQHSQPDWHNLRSMQEEDLEMAGFTDWKEYLKYEDFFPKLNQWFDVPKKQDKTIAIFGFAGYFRPDGRVRAPSIEYWNSLCNKLVKLGYKIKQFGAENEPEINLNGLPEYDIERWNKLDFFTQIKEALSCSFAIGTDSGSNWILSAYSFPIISLITNWNTNHNQNFKCLLPPNKNGIMLFNNIKNGGCNGVNQNLILEATKLF